MLSSGMTHGCLIRQIKVAFAIVIIIFLFFFVMNSRIENELDNENGIIFRRDYSPHVLQRITGLNSPDLVEITNFDYEREFAFSLSARDAAFLISRFDLKFDRTTSLKNLTNTIKYESLPSLFSIDRTAEIWEIYNNSFIKEDLHSIALGFDKDRAIKKYEITLIINKKIGYCFLRISGFLV